MRSKLVTMHNVKCACEVCRNTGSLDKKAHMKCKSCNGSGVRKVERGIMSMGVPCPECAGVGEVLSNPCTACRGESVVKRTREVRL